MTAQLTTLPPAERAVVALGSSALEIHLTDLVKKHADITAIANKAGRDQVHAAAMTLKGKRVEIQKRAKEVREDAVQFQKAVIAKGEELAAIIETEEKRLIALRDDWDAEREAEKQAAIAKEAMRRKHIKEMIDAIRNTVFVSPRESSASIEAIIAATDALDVSEATYEEFAPAAARAKAEALESLRETLDLAKFNEADQARIKAEQDAAAAQLAAERAEMERQLAEAQEQARIAAEKAEAERKEAAAKLEAERAEMEKVLAEQRAQAAAERKRMEDEQEAFRAQQAEFNRQKEELQRIEDERAAEAKRQQDEIEWAKAAAAKAAADILAAEKAEADRVEQARIQAAAEAAKQAEELAERLKREANTPQAGEIVTLIADHYRISNGAALDWLRGMFGDVRQAA